MNAFKNTLTAAQACDAAAAGVRRALPGAVIEKLPISDGGDGLIEALAPVLGGKIRKSSVEGPLGGVVRARWLMAGRTAVIEMAEASGLKRMGPGALRPLDASTRGVGQLILAASASGAREIIVGLGGSASNDGGAGCAEAAGFFLADACGRAAVPGARGLAELETVELVRPGAGLGGVRMIGLADVKNRLCGRLGSARVFGPQKGAGPREVVFIEKALRRYAGVIKESLGVDAGSLPGGAAAGGLGAGLAAFFGAELVDGAAYVLGKLDFERKLRRADLLVTGEGCFDRQTFYGKAPGAAIGAARKLGKPVWVLCGRSEMKNRRLLARLGILGVAESGLTPSPRAALRLAAARALTASPGK